MSAPVPTPPKTVTMKATDGTIHTGLIVLSRVEDTGVYRYFVRKPDGKTATITVKR